MSPTRLGTATLSEETASLHFGLSIYRLARAVEALVRGEKAPRWTPEAFAMPGADQKGESSSSSSEGGRGRRGAAASFRAGLGGMEKLDPVM